MAKVNFFFFLIFLRHFFIHVYNSSKSEAEAGEEF